MIYGFCWAYNPTYLLIAQPVMAQSVDKQAFEAQVFDVQADKPLQLAELSKQEMKETEGAAIWFAPAIAAGARFALTGFTRHGLNQAISRGGVGVSNRAILGADDISFCTLILSAKTTNSRKKCSSG